MATACELSEDQFHCSICHNVFAEPVTLPCGHNFCKKCIEQQWPISGKCHCPQCMKMFFYRPELKINLFISKMASQFLQSQYKARRRSESESLAQAPKPAEVLCDVCTVPKQRAHKSCQVCRSSYCETHLKPHLNMCGLKKHQLMEPVRDMKKQVSAEHVHLFCRSGQLCVCVDHQIVPLKEASEQRRQMFQKTEADIQQQISSRTKKIEELCGSVKVSNEAADREISDGVKVFTALKEAVQRGLDLLISEITKKKTHTEQQAQSFIQELEQEVRELERRGAEVKQLSQSGDLLHLLNPPELSPESPTKEWTHVNICPQTHEGAVLRALSELQLELSQKTKSVCEAELRRVRTKEVKVTLNGNTATSQLNHREEPGETTGELRRVRTQEVKVTLNGNTATPQVNHREEPHETTDKANQSDGQFVFGKESFSESFYFEAEVGEKEEWTLGVAEKSINKNSPIKLNPQSGFWSISLKNRALHISDNPKMAVSTKFSPERVGVFVDYEKGIISFFDVEAPALIHSFTKVVFKEKLSPVYQSDHGRELVCGTPREDSSEHMK